ncbi:MAG: alpha/beta hydrolase [Oligoflexia bacterium]|nr:alpha/beta hydrolase [Oligoflexia bacterium]
MAPFIQLKKKARPTGHRAKGRSTPALNPERPPLAHGYLQSPDGTRLFYSVEGAGKPLVFCYGLVCSSLHWTYQIEHFCHGYQAAWMDYRGHGNSDTPKDMNSLTVETLAQDLFLFLDEIGIKEAVFLGHSMGVNTVLEVYRQQPERVLGMVLANGTAKRPLETLLFNNNVLEPVFELARMLHRRSPALLNKIWTFQKGNPLARALIQFGGFNPHLTAPEDVQLYVDQMAKLDPSTLLHLIASYDSYDATSWLHEIKVPTLLIAGERDKITPLAQQELLHQLIPGSRLEVIKHGSHCPQMDLPDLVNVKIEQFLKELKY